MIKRDMVVPSGIMVVFGRRKNTYSAAENHQFSRLRAEKPIIFLIRKATTCENTTKMHPKLVCVGGEMVRE